MAILAFCAVIMSIHKELTIKEKLFWIVLSGALMVVELRSITKDHSDQTKTFQKIATEIEKTSDKSDQIIALLEEQSRLQGSSKEHRETLVKAWGKASELKTKAVQGAVASSTQPPQIQSGNRFVSAEVLGEDLNNKEHAAATIINDGTNESGNFAKQLVIGLRMAGWQAGGDNIKIGDPEFFPDSLTIEVSSAPASPEDHSKDDAKNLIAALNKQNVSATLRFTTLSFPPNFMRIKVSGR